MVRFYETNLKIFEREKGTQSSLFDNIIHCLFGVYGR